MTNALKSTGVTSDLISRVQEHKTKMHPKMQSIEVYYKNYSTIEEAILEEKRIKAGSRKQKCSLINSIPEWKDLWEEVGN